MCIICISYHLFQSANPQVYSTKDIELPSLAILVADYQKIPRTKWLEVVHSTKEYIDIKVIFICSLHFLKTDLSQIANQWRQSMEHQTLTFDLHEAQSGIKLMCPTNGGRV